MCKSLQIMNELQWWNMETAPWSAHVRPARPGRCAKPVAHLRILFETQSTQSRCDETIDARMNDSAVWLCQLACTCSHSMTRPSLSMRV